MEKIKFFQNDPQGVVCPYCKQSGRPCTFVNSMARAYARAACKKKHPTIPVGELSQGGS
jgi:hypothetical protein